MTTDEQLEKILRELNDKCAVLDSPEIYSKWIVYEQARQLRLALDAAHVLRKALADIVSEPLDIVCDKDTRTEALDNWRTQVIKIAQAALRKARGDV